jgi:hypothetical protein
MDRADDIIWTRRCEAVVTGPSFIVRVDVQLPTRNGEVMISALAEDSVSDAAACRKKTSPD